MSQASSKEVVASSWNRDVRLSSQLQAMADVLKNWNKTVFGNIFYKKRKIEDKIRGIQRVMDSNSSDFLFNLEKE